MRKSRDIKFKKSGVKLGNCILATNGALTRCGMLAGGGALVMLMFAMINPMVLSVWAAGESDTENNPPTIDEPEVTPSTVTFAFDPGYSVSGSMTPTTASGAKARVGVKATVKVENTGGYAVYFGSNSSNLTQKGGTATIAPVAAGGVKYDAMEADTWGYAYAEGETVADSATYVPVPATARGQKLYESAANVGDEEKTYAFSFAANISNSKPAGVYENNVLLSVVSSPMEVAVNDFGIKTMQDMTSAVCANATDVNGDGQITGQLEDVRDGKYYWVSKLKDGKCWMVQNLSLDITKDGLKAVDTDISEDWNGDSQYPPVETYSVVNATTIDGTVTGTLSWKQGHYVIAKPTASASCGSQKSSPSECPTQFVNVSGYKPSRNPTFYSDNGSKTVSSTEYDSHYLVGNQYQWNAATAGTGAKMTSGQAPGSICPKNWKLPTNGSGSGSFRGLLDAGGIGSDVLKLTSPPYYFVRSGYVAQNASTLYADAGDTGRLWTSAPTNTSEAYYLLFNSGSYLLYADYNRSKAYGYSVRCLAR